MDLLRSQFAKHDGRKTGSVSVQDFKQALQRFGVSGGLEPVVKKFTRNSRVDYESFLTHFQGRQGRQGHERQSQARGSHTVRETEARPQQQQQQQYPSAPSTPQLPSLPSWHNPNIPLRDEGNTRHARICDHQQQHHHTQQHDVHRVQHSDPQPRPPHEQYMPESLPPFVDTAHPTTPPAPPARPGMYDGIDVRRGSAGALDVHRSDSGSVAALALGEIANDKVDVTGLSHCGRRRRGTPLLRAHDATLPGGSVAVLSGADDSQARGRSGTPQQRRGRGHSGTAMSPARGYDVISGRPFTGSPARRDSRTEGKRHVNEPVSTTPKHGAGLRTFGESERPFAEARDVAQTSKGLRTGISGKTESHFSLGNNAAPTHGQPQWPEGNVTMRMSASHVSHIPGMSATMQEDAGHSKVQRKARTRTPSSFGYQQMTRRDMSPRPTRPRSSSPAVLRDTLGNKVSMNDTNVTKAWMNLTRDTNATGQSTGVSAEGFAEAVRSRYSLDIDAEDVKMLTRKEGPVTFNDFNKMCKAAPGAADLLHKQPDMPAKGVGRRCGELSGTRSSSRPPFATAEDGPPAAARRSKSSGAAGPLRGDARPQSARCEPDHYVTTNMKTFSPCRSRTPGGRASPFDVAAGLPNRRRDDSQRRKRCFSPITNQQSVGNLITHC